MCSHYSKQCLVCPLVSFQAPIISSLIESHKYSVKLLANSCLIQDHIWGMMIEKYRRQGNLYILDSFSFVFFPFNI